MRRSAKQVRLKLLGGASEFSGAPRSGFSAFASSPGAFLLALVVVGIVLGVIHNRWHHARHADPVLTGAGTVLYPAQVGATRVQNAALFSWDALFSGGRLKRENIELQAQISQLQQENESLRAKAAEADRLRDALGFAKHQSPAPLGAEVIGWLPATSVDTIVVARGARDGVRPGSIARTASGLVGQVTEAGLLSSQVLLLTDISSNVGALVMRNGKMVGVGIVQGTGRGAPLDLVYLRSDDVIKPGDRVISSGYGGVIPPDIPIGTIASVTEDSAHFLKAAKVTPLAPLPGDIREVFLLHPLEIPDTGEGGTGGVTHPTSTPSPMASSPLLPSTTTFPSSSLHPSPIPSAATTTGPLGHK